MTPSESDREKAKEICGHVYRQANTVSAKPTNKITGSFLESVIAQALTDKEAETIERCIEQVEKSSWSAQDLDEEKSICNRTVEEIVEAIKSLKDKKV